MVSEPSSSTTIMADSSSSSSPSLTQAHHFITIKLTNTNYLLWKTQVVPFLRGQSLFGFIDGSYPKPPATILNNDKEPQLIPNPEAVQWEKQEQLLQSLLISSLSESVMPLAVGQITAAGFWNVLATSLANTSHARILRLNIAMQESQLPHESGEAYLNRLKGIADELALAKRPLDDDSFNTFVFRGLRSEYDSLIDSLTTRGSSVSYSELLGLIRSKDILLSTHLSTLSISSSPSAPTVNVGRSSFQNHSNRPNPTTHHRPPFRPLFSPSHGDGLLPLPSTQGLSPRPSPPLTHDQSPRPSQPLSNGRRCYLCQSPYHLRNRCPHRTSLTNYASFVSPVANYAPTPPSLDPLAWLVDTGANFHTVPDLCWF